MERDKRRKKGMNKRGKERKKERRHGGQKYTV